MAAVCRRAGVDTEAAPGEGGREAEISVPGGEEVPQPVRGVLTARVDSAMGAAEP
jgi:hypothetical protein